MSHRAGSWVRTMSRNMRILHLVFKTAVSSYQSNNTFKIFKMEKESFKEYSEATIVEKEEL